MLENDFYEFRSSSDYLICDGEGLGRTCRKLLKIVLVFLRMICVCAGVCVCVSGGGGESSSGLWAHFLLFVDSNSHQELARVIGT